MLRIIGCLALVACTHTRSLHQVNEMNANVDVVVDIEGYGGVQSTTVPTTRGMAFRAYDGNDFLDPAQITRVTEVRRGRGALEGFLIGGGISATTFAILGYSAGDDECSSFCLFTFTAGEKAAMGGILGGITGGLVGLLVGAVRGSRFVYENTESVRITPTAPAGSQAGLTITF
jgi:hypothetical protein